MIPKLDCLLPTPIKQLEFIINALTNELPRKASEQEVLNILSRVHYPKVFERMIQQYLDEPLEQLKPVAKRLHAGKGKDVPLWDFKGATVEVERLRPLADLLVSVNGLAPSSYGSNALGAAYKSKKGGIMGGDEFKAWAVETELLAALDKFFRPFYTSK